MKIIAIAVSSAVLSGCADTARVFPMDDVAMASGTPKVEFVRQGMGRGPVTVTMPDGEILSGEYQITENAAIGVGFAGTHTATAIGMGSGRRVVISANGARTIMNCDGTADIGGHGSGVCESNHGAHYRVMF
jgi:hypothetical protein